MRYYLVAVGVNRLWKSDTFTYHHTDELAPGTLVIVPFGATKKIGTVVKNVSKPAIKTKAIETTLLENIPASFLRFKEWFQAYYSLSEQETNKHFFPSYITPRDIKDTLYVNNQSLTKSPQLTDIQLEAYKKISASDHISILHGITGSGKTRVYSELVQHTLEANKSVLLLYPEIALTSQLLESLRRTFPRVLVGHSQLTTKERTELWNTVAKQQEPTVIIGPRSSLFLPFDKLGAIIVDEFHESSYKQESGVRYNAVQVAAGLANAHQAKLLLGSATPPVTETKHIIDKGGQLVCMHKQAISSITNVSTKIISISDRVQFSKSSIISNELIKAISTSLERKEQSLLFLNKRGTAKKILCETCGWVAECPRCDLPLTYHQDTYVLLCHTCSYTSKPSSTCPSCGSKTEMKVPGSKAVVSELQKLFPHATIGRFDGDTKKSEQFHTVYEEVKTGKVDIVVGTQQIVKGLDLPLLSVVGVLDADTSLYFPDYSSDERTFQLLTQVRGRIGRGHRNGTLVIQTRQPQSQILTFVLNGDWHGYYEQELAHRNQYHFPPYQFLAKIIVRSKNTAQLERITEQCLELLRMAKQVRIRGPLLPIQQKKGGIYTKHIIVEAKKRSVIQAAISQLPKEVIVDLDPIHLL